MRLSLWGRRKPRKNATRALERQALALRTEDPDRALELFRAVLAKDPASAVSLRAAGRLLMKARRLEEARPYWEKLARALPDDPEPHVQLGRIHRRAGRQDIAQSEADAALRLAPHHAAAHDLKLRLGYSAEASQQTPRQHWWRRLFARSPPAHTRIPEPTPVTPLGPDALMARARACAADGDGLGFVRTMETLLVTVGPSRNIVDLAVANRALVRRAASGRLLTLLDLALAADTETDVLAEAEAELARRAAIRSSGPRSPLALVLDARGQIEDGDIAAFLRTVRTALAVDGPTPALVTLIGEHADVVRRSGEPRLLALVERAPVAADDADSLAAVEAELARRARRKASSARSRARLIADARSQMDDSDVASFLRTVRTALAVDGPSPELVELVGEQAETIRRSGDERLLALVEKAPIEEDPAGLDAVEAELARRAREIYGLEAVEAKLARRTRDRDGLESVEAELARRSREQDGLEAIEAQLARRERRVASPADELLGEAARLVRAGDDRGFLRALRTSLSVDGPSPALMSLVQNHAEAVRASGDPRLGALLDFNAARADVGESRSLALARMRLDSGDVPGFLKLLEDSLAADGPTGALADLARANDTIVRRLGGPRLQALLASGVSFARATDPLVATHVGEVQAALADDDLPAAARALESLAELGNQDSREALGAQAESVLLALRSGRAAMMASDLVELEASLAATYAHEPWVIQALARQRELDGDTAGALALYSTFDDFAAGAGPALLHAATLAAGTGETAKAWDFARRARLASPQDRRLIGALSDLFLRHGETPRAIEIWRSVEEAGGAPLWARLGLVRVLETSGDRAAVAAETQATLRDMAPLAQLNTADRNLLVDLIRHLVQSQARARGPERLDEMAAIVAHKEPASPLRQWILASIDLARPNVEAALANLDRGIEIGPAEGVSLDLNAEKALALQRYHRFGEAYAAWEAADEDKVKGNGHYARRRDFVRQVAELCGDAGPLLYPECLFDVLFEEIANSKPAYQPNLGHLVMISGSLGQGGGERQTITVVRRMIGDARLAKLSLLVRSTHMRENDDFFLSRVSELPVDLTVYGVDWLTRTDLGALLPEFVDRPRIIAAIDLMPTNSREEVARLCRQLFDRRPQAAHIWQDIPYAAVACALVGVPNFFIHRGSLAPDYWAQNDYQTATHFRPMRHIYRRLLERPDFVLLNNSVSGCQTDQAWVGWPDAGRFQVVYNAVDFSQLGEHVGRNFELRRELGIADDAPVIGGSFRIVEVKRPLYWIEAARQVRAAVPNAHFLIIGDGEMTEEVAAFAAEHGFGEAVHLPGRVSNVGDWYRAMDLKLMTSEREGIPNAIIEAQHFGVPIVATHVGGIHEAIDPGETGFVTPGDKGPDPYAAQIIDVLRDSAWHEAARQKAPAFVHDKFSLDTVVERLMGYYGMSRKEP